MLGAALDPEHEHHLFVGMATGGGKTLAQLLLPLLSPEGVSPVTCYLSHGTCHLSPATCHQSHGTFHQSPFTCHLTHHLSRVNEHLSPAGTTSIIVAPLTAILEQMATECDKLGITYIDLSQVLH